MESDRYILAIETGIGRGSFSIIKSGKILDFRVGDSKFRGADNLIRNIAELFALNGIEKSKIERIVYSVYPGSHTGLKVGAAAAKGFGAAWGIDARQKNLFDCVADEFFPKTEAGLIIILPIGKTDLEWRVYSGSRVIFETGCVKGWKTEWKDFEMLFESVGEVCLPSALIEDFRVLLEKLNLDKRIRVVDLGDNLSVFVGLN